MTPLALLGRVVDEANAGQLPVLIAEWDGAPDHRRWLARGLRLDLPVLAARPELAMPCLLRRCAELGAEAWFYRIRPEPPADAATLRELAAAWRSAWSQPYLRALRPPELPLDGGVLEEYRTSAEGPLWLTDDAVGVGTAIAWERASGRRIASPYVAPAERPVWKTDLRQQTDGIAVLHRGGDERAVRLPHDHEAWTCTDLGDELCIVEARTFDGDDFQYHQHLVHVPTGKVRWSIATPCRSVQRVGDRVYFAGPEIAVHDLATGEPVAIYLIDGAHLVATRSGQLATREGHVIRVWDPARVAVPEIELASTFRWLELSPDDTQLVTGYIVCDARTGAYAGVADLRGVGGWLEGGPPANCRRLCDGRIVELMPFGLTAWTTRPRVTRAIEHRDLDGRVGDAVAFDRAGRLVAVWRRRRDATLRVSTVDDSREVFAHATELGDSWKHELGFSPDSTRLWWRDSRGSHHVATLATGEVRMLAPGDPPLPAEPAPIAAAVRDGLLVAGELAIPIDATDAIASRDGRVFAAWNAHYRIEG